MSRSYEILISGCESIEQVVEFIGSFIGYQFDKHLDVEREFYDIVSVGFNIQIFEMKEGEYQDDAGIEFSRYSIMVSIDDLSSMRINPYFEEWFRQLPLLLGYKISQELKVECAVIYETQVLIATFNPQKSSQPRYVRMPDEDIAE